MKALVLSGGGSRGSYQIGVWKALRKLNIKFDIVTGTSVGALNGALMVTGNYLEGTYMWKKLNMNMLFGVDKSVSKNKKVLLKTYANKFISNGGMNESGIEEVLKKVIDLDMFYESNIDFGLNTYNLTTKKEVKLTKKEIPKDKLIDYLMASATCYPAFQMKDIEGDKYVDGGYYNNFPIDLAIQMGATELITVDISVFKRRRKVNNTLPTVKIKPNNKLSNFLNFNSIDANRNIKLGYNDTMKVYKKLEGKKYTFKLNTINKIMDNYMDEYTTLFGKVLNEKHVLNKFKKSISNKVLLKDKYKTTINIIEKVCEYFNLDETNIYSLNILNSYIKYYFKKLDNKNIVVKMYKDLSNHRYKSLRRKALLNPIDFIITLYIYVIKEV